MQNSVALLSEDTVEGGECLHEQSVRLPPFGRVYGEGGGYASGNSSTLFDELELIKYARIIKVNSWATQKPHINSKQISMLITVRKNPRAGLRHWECETIAFDAVPDDNLNL